MRRAGGGWSAVGWSGREPAGEESAVWHGAIPPSARFCGNGWSHMHETSSPCALQVAARATRPTRRREEDDRVAIAFGSVGVCVLLGEDTLKLNDGYNQVISN